MLIVFQSIKLKALIAPTRHVTLSIRQTGSFARLVPCPFVCRLIRVNVRDLSAIGMRENLTSRSFVPCFMPVRRKINLINYTIIFWSLIMIIERQIKKKIQHRRSFLEK